jgi:hypothetical protein
MCPRAISSARAPAESSPGEFEEGEADCQPESFQALPGALRLAAPALAGCPISS